MTQPVSAYGRAKLEMERAVLEWAKTAPCSLTILRLGNVAGADALLGRARPDAPVVLDPAPGGAGPVRSYIGPRSLADVLARLFAAALEGPLPQMLNVAAAPPVDMADLLRQAGLDWRFGPATANVIPRVVLSTERLQALCPLSADAGSAATLVAEWRSLT